MFETALCAQYLGLQIDLFEPGGGFPVGEPDLQCVAGHAAEQNGQLADEVCGGVAFADGFHVRDDVVERLQQHDGEEQHDAGDVYKRQVSGSLHQPAGIF